MVPDDQVGRFAIISVPRTGSNYLCSALNAHPDILCHHEVFNLDGVRLALDLNAGALGTMAEREADPVGFLQRMWRQPMGRRHLGFKLAWRHDQRVFDDVIADRAVRKIILTRRNQVKMYVSEQVAKAEGRWTHYGERSEALPQIHVDIEPDDLRRYVAVMDDFFAGTDEALAASGQTPLRLCYEDLFLPSTPGNVLAFLGASDAALKGATPKRNPTDLRRVVRNFDEVRDALADTSLTGQIEDTAL